MSSHLSSSYCNYFFVILLTFAFLFFFFFNDTATTEIYTLSLHDALPISRHHGRRRLRRHRLPDRQLQGGGLPENPERQGRGRADRVLRRADRCGGRVPLVQLPPRGGLHGRRRLTPARRPDRDARGAHESGALEIGRAHV